MTTIIETCPIGADIVVHVDGKSVEITNAKNSQSREHDGSHEDLAVYHGLIPNCPKAQGCDGTNCRIVNP